MVTYIKRLVFFSQRDIDLIKGLYDGTASAVRLPTGTSAWIEQRSGVLQGAPESCPLANLVVGAFIRFLQATKGVGFAHHDGSREFVLGYADDLCLVANTTAEMQVLLHQVELFCARTGLELNVAKTVVQGIDYATGADLRPHLTYEGCRIPCLPARKGFKYLGCYGDLTLNFREERARILRRTAEAANLIRKHTHDPTQMTELVRSSILTIFQYSCAFVNWFLNDFDEVGKRPLARH